MLKLNPSRALRLVRPVSVAHLADESTGLPLDRLVGCGLTSHSAIFQLYSDGTVVQFSKF